MDNSDKLFEVDVTPDGLGSSSITGGLTLTGSRDFEGAVYADSVRHSVFLSEEGMPGVHDYSLEDGLLLKSLPVPRCFRISWINLGLRCWLGAVMVWRCTRGMRGR